MSISKDEPGVRKALEYFRDDQLPEGTWKFPLLKDRSLPALSQWLDFVLCRIFKRFSEK